MTPIVLSFDMDDTLCETGEYINDQLYKVARQRNDVELLEFLDTNSGHLSTMLYPPNVKKVVNTLIIGPGIYMLDAVKTPLFCDRFIGILQELKRLYGSMLKIVVCSHRGFHEYGEIYTRKWLAKVGALELFDDIHMLDGKQDPDKIQFLKKTYPGSPIKLVDDNPLHDFTKEHDHQEEIMIYDKVHTFPGYKHQTRLQGISCIVSWVNTIAQTQEV